MTVMTAMTLSIVDSSVARPPWIWDPVNVFALNEAVVAWMGVEPTSNTYPIYQRHLDILREAVVAGKLKTLQITWIGNGRSYTDVWPGGTLVGWGQLREFFESIGEYPAFLFPYPSQNEEVIELKQRIAELEVVAAQKDLSTKERNTFLKIIRVVAEMDKIDISRPSAAASTIVTQAQTMGVDISESAIPWLRRWMTFG